ncbi:MAG: hypothetical protein Q7U04_07510 [Bacteriovorax sp.]|nr:hypothetical protein [Bacteriovorax sp.]
MKLKGHFILFIFSGFLMTISSSPIKAAEADGIEYKNMEQMMGAIRLEKKQIEGMLDKMVKSGRITNEEGTKAKREIASIKDNDLEILKTRAIAEVKSKKLLDP